MGVRICNAFYILVLFLSGCVSLTEPYDLIFTNVSSKDIDKVHVIWGENYYNSGIVIPGKSKSIGALQEAFPEKATIFWENVTGDKNEKKFAIKAILPKLGKDKGYQFHFEISQEEVRLIVQQDDNIEAWLEKHPEYQE